MKKRRGTFIVLEGLDGSGTTTQAKKLHHHFQSNKIKSTLTCEPTDNAIGKLIRDMLTGKLYSPESNRKIAPSEKALCLLFAADRLEHSKDIESFLERTSVRGVEHHLDAFDERARGLVDERVKHRNLRVEVVTDAPDARPSLDRDVSNRRVRHPAGEVFKLSQPFFGQDRAEETPDMERRGLPELKISV